MADTFESNTRQNAILYDVDGNAYLVQDGVVVPVNTPHGFIGGEHTTDGKAYHARMIDDTTTAGLKRIMVEATLAPGTTVATTSGAPISQTSITEFLTNATHAEDMVQDGSGADITYKYDAHATLNTHLTGLRITFSANSFNFNGNSFGKANTSLTNGILVRYTVNGGVTKDLITIMINEDFERLLEFAISQAGNEDSMAASLVFGGDTILEAGTADKIEVLVRDDITTNNWGVFYLTATLYGFEQVP